MWTITTYRKSGRLFILRVMAIFVNSPPMLLECHSRRAMVCRCNSPGQSLAPSLLLPPTTIPPSRTRILPSSCLSCSHRTYGFRYGILASRGGIKEQYRCGLSSPAQGGRWLLRRHCVPRSRFHHLTGNHARAVLRRGEKEVNPQANQSTHNQEDHQKWKENKNVGEYCSDRMKHTLTPSSARSSRALAHPRLGPFSKWRRFGRNN